MILSQLSKSLQDSVIGINSEVGVTKDDKIGPQNDGIGGIFWS